MFVLDDSCYMVYHPDSWKWLYPKDTQCGRVLPVFNMYKNFLLIGIMGVLDLATLYFLHKHHKVVLLRSEFSDSLTVHKKNDDNIEEQRRS